ncbi:Piso0_000808 [Millerozyma farinosa CBS 7064]|uniref:Piso0_000808 protein n=1 Tax=Pichia sorbitophila (strain ATCC MYA-4447 / BCRC 22081 / CBS 7064 / NBRC 10061 / NRRL Y-12695) TaxID=559304 RepID=G8YRK4_PICSO|nr:Piso0_000808 [Millerozyma farinosa CBS 7064]
MTTVFVSGATGFIAQETVKQLVQKGYKVIGSVRSAERGDRLKKNLGSDNFTYEIVEDIQKEGSFDETLKKHPEVTIFLHTASPFHFKTTDIENDLLKPAVEGTKNALKAIKEHGPNVKKVVITSSFAAIKKNTGDDNPNLVLTEESWNDSTKEQAVKDPLSGYIASKAFAEKAAWEFLEKEKPQFVLSTVNPTLVLGPQAFISEIKNELNTSSEVINSILKSGPNDPLPPILEFFIDVRDVAKAHIAAFEKKEAEGKRLLVSEGRFVAQNIVDYINKDFPQFKGKIAAGNPGQYPDFNAFSKIDNSKTREILGFDFINFETCVKDTVQQILDAGFSR